jgi:hypothetical protein
VLLVTLRKSEERDPRRRSTKKTFGIQVQVQDEFYAKPLTTLFYYEKDVLNPKSAVRNYFLPISSLIISFSLIIF